MVLNPIKHSCSFIKQYIKDLTLGQSFRVFGFYNEPRSTKRQRTGKMCTYFRPSSKLMNISFSSFQIRVGNSFGTGEIRCGRLRVTKSLDYTLKTTITTTTTTTTTTTALVIIFFFKFSSDVFHSFAICTTGSAQLPQERFRDFQFPVECCKTKNKVITLTNHNTR